MFVVYKYFDYDGEPIYKKSSLIGVYEYIEDAKNDLTTKLTRLKYEFEIECDTNDYFSIEITKKKGVDFITDKRTFYEIMKFKTSINTIKL
jgi:hypothetical protein